MRSRISSVHWGWPLLIVLAGLPIMMWLNMLPLGDRLGNSYLSLTSLGRIAGIAAIVLYCFNLILTTRLQLIESLFGGLNKMFIAHHIVGGLAICLALFHSLALTLRLTTVSFKDAAKLSLPFTTNWPTTFGVIGLWLFIVLMILTFYIHLPYRIWLFTHKFLGLAFLFIGLHVIYISGDITSNRMLKNYLLALIAIAAICFVYRTLLPRFFARRYAYRISNVEQLKSGEVRITMMPQNRRLDFKSGQFIFVSFRFRGFSHEWHPFSISSNSAGSGLAITVKNLGQYTGSLIKSSSAMVGSDVWIEGAYGRFSFRNFHSTRQIWVAGGIGITPFLSMVPDVKPNYLVDLYYSVKNPNELIDYPQIEQWCKASSGALRVIPVITDRDGFLTADKIKQYSGDMSTCDILLCGPPPMMHALRGQFKQSGVKNHQIHSEEFSMS